MTLPHRPDIQMIIKEKKCPLNFFFTDSNVIPNKNEVLLYIKFRNCDFHVDVQGLVM